MSIANARPGDLLMGPFSWGGHCAEHSYKLILLIRPPTTPRSKRCHCFAWPEMEARFLVLGQASINRCGTWNPSRPTSEPLGLKAHMVTHVSLGGLRHTHRRDQVNEEQQQQ